MAAATWVAEISWNNDTDYSDTGENVTARVQTSPGIVTERGRDQIRSLAPPMAGRCDFALNNASKDYSPENASSPLYGNLLPGRPVRVRTTAPSATNIWRGNLDDLPQDPRLRQGFVRVPALGTLAKLKGVKVSTDLYTNVTTSAALTTLFAAAGLAAADYTMLDTGKTTLTAWWCAEDDAFAMLVSILAAEGPGAAIYENGNGVITFHSRHYRLLTSRCTTSQATFGNVSTEPKHSPPFGYEPNLKGVVNQCSIETRSLVAEAFDGDLATATFDPIEVPFGETLDMEFTLSTPATGVAGTLTTAAGQGAGVAIDRTSGAHFVVTVTALSSPSTTFTAIGLEGTPYAAGTARVAQTVDTSASVAKYGVRPLPTNWTPWPYIALSVARSFANAIVGAYQEPRATVNIAVNNGHATRLTHMLAREISDRITVTEGQTGINGPVFIERIRHEVREGGRFHKTVFGCEKIAAGYGDYYIVGTSLVGTGRAGF